jgi:molybdopterin-containing oxidoreductase family membrane subunit
LAYAYLKFWDLAAVTYYGQTPAVNAALAMLNDHTAYNFGFWVGEILIGIVAPVIIFLHPRLNRSPAILVSGGIMAVIGVIVNRWNVTVSGLTVPLSYSPGTQYVLPASEYFPSLSEWGIALGIIGYALFMLTLGVKLLPLFSKEEQH